MRAAGIAALVLLVGVTQPPRYDFVLAGGTLIDGTGRPAVKTDVAVSAGRIAAIGTIPRANAARRIDAAGFVVAPGFVDVLTHADDIAAHPAATNFVGMGVTTVVGGNLGVSAIEIGDALDRIRDAGIAINYATLIGHGTVRRAVMGDDDGLPSPSALARMKALVWKGMADGAIGLSVERRDAPGSFAKYPELAELARVAATAGGLYATDLAAGSVADAITEVVAIGDATGGRIEISHLMRGAEADPDDVLGRLAKARERGIHLLADTDAYGGVDRVIANGAVAIASDSRIADQGDPPAPGGGNTARFLATFVRDRHVLSMEEAVRKMTSLPAEHYRLSGRGVLRPGAPADLVVFDPASIAPAHDGGRQPAGIRDVYVNGVAVLQNGVQTAARPGRVLARSLLERQ